MNRGIAAALGAAVLFGCSTPLAKLLLQESNPWLLAALLYLGSGAGLAVYRLVTRQKHTTMAPSDWGWLGGAVVAGGVAAPVLLLFGLGGVPASSASLLLNAEGVFTTLLAWFVFRENFDRRIVAGMLAVIAGGVILTWQPGSTAIAMRPALAIVGACLAWAIDNNLTRKVALQDATWIACIKGLVAGSINGFLALAVGAAWPPAGPVLAALLVGCFSYGISLVLFIVALRDVGTARTGAYFSVAPFFGAALAIPLLSEPLTARFVIAGLLMALGIWLHLTERHKHMHFHPSLEHEHEHTHDIHHRHQHEAAVPPSQSHTHRHRHDALTHEHVHYPDAHHQHKH